MTTTSPAANPVGAATGTSAAPSALPVPSRSTSSVPEPSLRGRLRASHAEREQAIARLHVAPGEGRIDLDEAEGRTAVAYLVRYDDELPVLLSDLPTVGHHPESRALPTSQSVWKTLAPATTPSIATARGR